MKKIFQIFFFLFSIIIFSQEESEEYSAFNFEKNTFQRILIDKTKLRINPELNTLILDSLPINQEVKILSRTKKLTKIGERNAPWFKISYDKNGKTNEGYIWGGNLALGHRKYKDIQFLFGVVATQKIKDKDYNSYHDETIARVIALRENTVISERNFEMGSSENLNSFGFTFIENKNLKNVDFIIKTYVSGDACAIPTYDQYFFWTNNSFYKLPKLMSVSDAGIFHYEESYIFPNLKKVKANTILKIIEKSETDENDKTKTSKKTKTYFWDGKVLK